MSDVSAGLAANLAVFEEDELDNEIEQYGPEGLSPADAFGGPEIGGSAGGKHHYDGQDQGHDHAAELSDKGVTVFNYSMRDRMDGDGGETNKIGYRNFSPVSSEDLDTAERRRKEADEHLFLVLEQYEAAQRLAEIDARLAELAKEIKDLETKIEALDRAFQIGDDADINDDSLAGLAKRNQMRRSLREAGLDPDEYFKADGSFDQEKWLRDQERNREIQRAYEERVRRAYEEQRTLSLERERMLRDNPQLSDTIARQAAGDPEARAAFAGLAKTQDGSIDLSHTVINNSPTLDTQAKVETLTQIGPEGRTLATDSAQLIVASTVSGNLSLENADMAWGGAIEVQGTTAELSSGAHVQVAATLPETLPELFEPALGTVPAGGRPLQIPDIRIIDLIPEGLKTSAAAGTERSVGSVAAELGFDTVDTGIRPISGTFAQAVSAQTAPQQVAAPDAEAALDAERQRLPAGTGGAQVSTPVGMA